MVKLIISPLASSLVSCLDWPLSFPSHAWLLNIMTFLFNFPSRPGLPRLFPWWQWLVLIWPHGGSVNWPEDTISSQLPSAPTRPAPDEREISLLLSLLVFSLQVNFLFSPDNPSRPQSRGQLLYKPEEILDNLKLFLGNYFEKVTASFAKSFIPIYLWIFYNWTVWQKYKNEI